MPGVVVLALITKVPLPPWQAEDAAKVRRTASANKIAIDFFNVSPFEKWSTGSLTLREIVAQA